MLAVMLLAVLVLVSTVFGSGGNSGCGGVDGNMFCGSGDGSGDGGFGVVKDVRCCSPAMCLFVRNVVPLCFELSAFCDTSALKTHGERYRRVNRGEKE